MRIRTSLVDNDEATLRLLLWVASERGHDVVAMTEPATCPLYSGFTRRCPRETACGDLLLTGNSLPALSGLDLLERQALLGCKRMAQNKAVLSATWSDDDLHRAERLECRVFKKPFLVREIDEWMAEREQQLGSDPQPAQPPSGGIPETGPAGR